MTDAKEIISFRASSECDLYELEQIIHGMTNSICFVARADGAFIQRFHQNGCTAAIPEYESDISPPF